MLRSESRIAQLRPLSPALVASRGSGLYHFSHAGFHSTIGRRTLGSRKARAAAAARQSTRAHWSAVVETLSEGEQFDFQKTFNRCREVYLDTCHGRCLLRRPELSKIVADSLLHFDTQHYRMGDFIVMPNHVHLLAVFSSADTMKEQCDSWLHYTAFRINQAIGESGKFWQQEPFDHLVRSPE